MTEIPDFLFRRAQQARERISSLENWHCPSESAQGREDRCGMFSFPVRCTIERCSEIRSDEEIANDYHQERKSMPTEPTPPGITPRLGDLYVDVSARRTWTFTLTGWQVFQVQQPPEPPKVDVGVKGVLDALAAARSTATFLRELVDSLVPEEKP